MVRQKRLVKVWEKVCGVAFASTKGNRLGCFRRGGIPFVKNTLSKPVSPLTCYPFREGWNKGEGEDISAAGKHEKATVICLGGAVKFRLITMKTGLWRGCSACRKNAETPAFQFDCKSQGQKGSFKGRLTMGHELLKHQWPGTAKRDCKTCFYPGGTRVSCRLNRASI